MSQPARAPSCCARAATISDDRDERTAEELLELLDERSPAYSGLSEAAASRLLASALLGFERTGLPAAAMAHVREELTSSRNPHVVAGAARALRGVGEIPPDIPNLLIAALVRVGPFDAPIAPDDSEVRTTAATEVLRTIAKLGPAAASLLPALKGLAADPPPLFAPSCRQELEAVIRAVSASEPSPGSCCGSAGLPVPEPGRAHPAAAEVAGVLLQDQSGAEIDFAGVFAGKVGVLAFFYTRCGNPERCSLTIAKLAGLQRRLREAGRLGGVALAAISYDPTFDRPERLLAYGADRGIVFDGSARLLRTVGALDRLSAHFRLGVAYGPVTVNRHRVEIFVLDRGGKVLAEFSRLSPSVEALFQAVETALGSGGTANRAEVGDNLAVPP